MTHYSKDSTSSSANHDSAHATTTTTPDFRHVFAKLRTDRGLSIDQLSQLTRINPRFLEAMESGQFSELPSLVIGRAFVRTVCRECRVSDKDIIAAYNAANPAIDKVQSLNIRPSRGLDSGPLQIAQSQGAFERVLTSFRERTGRPLWENVKAVRSTTSEALGNGARTLVRRHGRHALMALAALLTAAALWGAGDLVVKRVKIVRARAAEKARLEATQRQARVAEEARLAAEAAAEAAKAEAASLPNLPSNTAAPVVAAAPVTPPAPKFVPPAIPLVLAPTPPTASPVTASIAPTAASAPAVATAPVAKPARPRVPQMVELIVKAPVKATFQLDGGASFSANLAPDHYRYGFQERADITVQDGSAVEILYNGAPVATEKAPGKPARIGLSARSEKTQKL